MEPEEASPESMNSLDTPPKESSAILPADTNSRPQFERLAQLMWAIVLAAPLPLVSNPIISDLAKIASWQVYLINILIWLTAFATLLILVFYRWNKSSQFPDQWSSRILTTAGMACYLASIFTLSTQLAALGWLLQSAAWLATHSGANDNGRWRLLMHLPPLCMLLQMPEFVAKKANLVYEHLLSTTTASLFEYANIPFRRENSNFEFARFEFSTSELIANSPYIAWLLFACCLLVCWLRRPIVLLPAYLGVALFWIFGLHLMQMIALGFSHQIQGLELSKGWQAGLLNASMLAASVGLLFSGDRCLRILFMPVPLESATRGPINPLIALWNTLFLPLATNNHTGSVRNV